MNKKDTEELNELSLQCFGKPYEWRKLRSKGLVNNIRRVGKGATARRTPLTLAGVKQYMEMTLKMREEMKKDMEKK